MRCKKCKRELVMVDYVECGSKRIYGICFGCDEICHIKPKKNGRCSVHFIQSQHIPLKIVEYATEEALKRGL